MGGDRFSTLVGARLLHVVDAVLSMQYRHKPAEGLGPLGRWGVSTDQLFGGFKCGGQQMAGDPEATKSNKTRRGYPHQFLQGSKW